MTPSRLPPRVLALVAILTLVWGTNWPLFVYAVREMSVWTFRALSVTLAGLALLAVARLRGQSLVLPRAHWPAVVLATSLYLVLWNIASTYAAVTIPSGQAAILGYSMPLWVALLSWLVLGERLPGRVQAALAFGAAAVGLLMWRGLDAYAEAPFGFAMGLVAGLGWAAGTLIIKRRPPPVPPLVLTGWQLLITALPVTIGAFLLAEGGWFVPSWTTIAVIAYISLVPMGLGNWAWFSIVGLLPASVAGLTAIAVPMVAMVSGAIIHGEPLGPLQWLAMGCCAVALRFALVPPGKG